MSNVDLLKQYFVQENIEPNTWENEEGKSTSFEFPQKLKTGANGRLLIVLDEDIVNIYALDYVSLTNTARKEYICKVINEINTKYTYFKFYLDNDNNLILQSSMPIRDNFNAELTFDILSGAYRTMEKEYSDIMKAMWS